MTSKSAEILESWREQARREWEFEKYELHPPYIAIVSWEDPDPLRVLPEVSRIYMEAD